MDLPQLNAPVGPETLGHCFACGENNPIGLKLKPRYDGEKVTAVFTPTVDHQGWFNITHGGILYTLLDEVTAYSVLCGGYSFGVTAKSSVRFKSPAATDVELLASAWVTKATSRLIETHGQLQNPDGTIVAEVESSFLLGQRCTKAFIWDMDGVIVDSGEPHFQSWHEAFAMRGVSYTREHFHDFFGTRDDLIIKRMLGDVSAEDIREIEDWKEARYRELVNGNVKVLPGVMPLLKVMKSRGFKVALGTSAPLENVHAVAADIGLDEYFDAVVHGREVGEGKPSPEIYLTAAERLGADPADCIVFEDSPHGVEAARKAGMKCVAITNSHPAEELSAATRVVDSLEEIDLIQLIRWV